VELSLIQKTFENQIQKSISSIHKMENVPNNHVFKIEAESESYIFKIYSKRNWPEDGKVPFIYRKLDEFHISHAQLFVFDREDENFPNGYLIEQCLPGTTADRLALSKDDTVLLFEKLAALVSRVHQISMINYGYTGGGAPAGWTTFSEFLYDVLTDNSDSLIANGFMETEELQNVNKAIHEKLKHYDVFPSVLCHGDLSEKNILVDTNEITLIDWDDAQSLPWVADITRLTFWMEIHYNEQMAATCKKAFLDCYETVYDKKIYYEMEDALHVWYGLDNLTFFTEGAVCDKVKKLLQDSRNKCGI